MDTKPSNSDTDSFVDDRMARLDPSPDWKPDAGLALKRLSQRQPSSGGPWMRLVMTASILAATIFVLVLLPWQRLWTPEPVATVAAKTQSAPTEKPVEKPQETPAPQQPAEAVPQAPQAPAASTPEQAKGDALLDLPDNEADLLQYLQELAKARGVAAQAASQKGDTNPVVVRNVLPEYSDEAKKERIKGTVILRVTVRTDGTVQFESFQQTLGYGLDEKAREAVEQWLFTPGTKDGIPVARTVDLNVNFSLR